MANFYNLVLDTTAPAGVTAVINSNAAFTSSPNVSVAISTSDTPTTGYTMKVYGDISGGPATEAAATWVTYSTSSAQTLTAGDGVKTINVVVRDDVGNPAPAASDSITLDSTIPVVTVGTPSASKISKQAGFRTSTNTFQADEPFTDYQVRVVPGTGSIVTAGTLIPTTNGSTNMSATAGSFPATTNINISIDGADLEAASATDGTKIVKVFVKDASGSWSV